MATKNQVTVRNMTAFSASPFICPHTLLSIDHFPDQLFPVLGYSYGVGLGKPVIDLAVLMTRSTLGHFGGEITFGSSRSGIAAFGIPAQELAITEIINKAVRNLINFAQLILCPLCCLVYVSDRFLVIHFDFEPRRRGLGPFRPPLVPSASEPQIAPAKMAPNLENTKFSSPSISPSPEPFSERATA